MDAPAATARLFLLIVYVNVVAVSAGRAGGANVVWIALEPPLHLALDLGVCDAGGGLQVGGVDLAGQGDGRGLGGLRSVVWHASSDAKELEEVVELAVDVAAHCDGRADGLDVGLCRLSDGSFAQQHSGGLIPSIRHSLTISHRRFMSASGRYLHCFACSSHSSGPAPFARRAGPGWGTSLSLGMVAARRGASAAGRRSRGECGGRGGRCDGGRRAATRGGRAAVAAAGGPSA